MRAKDFVPASKPRNFVAKNQKTAGAGAHKDKKRAEKQGDAKHKKDLIPMEDSRTAKHLDTINRPVSTSSEKVKTFGIDGYTVNFNPDIVEIYHGQDLVYSKPGNYANPTRLQLSSMRRIITHLEHKKKQDVAEAGSPAQQAAIAINMKKHHKKPKNKG